MGGIIMGITIRKATATDLDAVSGIYDRIHDEIEAGRASIGWIRGDYPTRATAEASLSRGDLCGEELNSEVGCTAILNQTQVDAYFGAPWEHDVPENEVMVLHTLVIDPSRKGAGLGQTFEAYYERYALDHGCRALRIDTNARNTAARNFYRKLGYREIAIVPVTFNGIPGVDLVLLEKYLG